MTDERLAPKVEPIPKGHRTLLAEFYERNMQGDLPARELLLPKGEPLKFNLGEDTADLTVYNPTKPVIIGGQTYIWVRVDKGKNEKDSVVKLFKEGKNGEWDVVRRGTVLKVCKILSIAE